MKTNVQPQKTNYPIAEKKAQILEALTKHQVICIVGPTGSGKSTQVPQYLLEAGYDHITATVPSRAAATTLAKRVADETNSYVGEIVGYQTAFEKEPGRLINFRTEGYQLMRELYNDNGNPNSVLIIDELQEWSSNVEALIGFLKHKIDNGYKTKIILMSASMDESVATFLSDAPIIRVEGRMFPVTTTSEPGNLLNAIVRLHHENRNILVFLPGKHEIAGTIHKLKKLNLHEDAVIYPLHADLPIEAQMKVFEPSSQPKIIVATNVAQTSITIPDIDAVVDSGLERRIESSDKDDLFGGIATLNLGNISQSDVIQRKGRAGRTREGVYVYCGNTPIEELQEYPTPDIYTSNLTTMILRLASVQISATSLTFFHQPPIQRILDAQKTLRTLGAFDQNNNITEIGDVMAKLPISAHYSRMLVEAQKRNVLEDVLTIVAIQECGGLKLPDVPYGQFSKEMSSDFLADLDCFNYLRKKLANSTYSLDFESNNPFEGVNKRNYYRILELKVKLSDTLYEIYDDISSTGDRRDISLSCASGLVEYLYIKQNNAWYASVNDPFKRKIDRGSCIMPAKMILAVPRNISLQGHVAENETQILYLLSSGMVVDINTLHEIAPDLIIKEEENVFDPKENEYYVQSNTFFSKELLCSSTEIITDVNEKRSMLSTWLAHNTFNHQEDLDPRLDKVLDHNSKSLNNFNEAKNFYLTALKKAALNSVPSMAKPKNYELLEI